MDISKLDPNRLYIAKLVTEDLASSTDMRSDGEYLKLLEFYFDLYFSLSLLGPKWSLAVDPIRLKCQSMRLAARKRVRARSHPGLTAFLEKEVNI
jgi:hypothetical protein